MDDVFISWDLDKIELSELIVIVGSYLFSGHTIDTVETDVIEKLSELISNECKNRLTEVPKHEIIH